MAKSSAILICSWQVETNHDDTIIYEIPDEQEVQVQNQQEPQHEESTDIGGWKYFPMYLLDNLQPEIVTTIPEDNYHKR